MACRPALSAMLRAVGQMLAKGAAKAVCYQVAHADLGAPGLESATTWPWPRSYR
jgi:hypothetical protein